MQPVISLRYYALLPVSRTFRCGESDSCRKSSCNVALAKTLHQVLACAGPIVIPFPYETPHRIMAPSHIWTYHSQEHGFNGGKGYFDGLNCHDAKNRTPVCISTHLPAPGSWPFFGQLDIFSASECDGMGIGCSIFWLLIYTHNNTLTSWGRYTPSIKVLFWCMIFEIGSIYQIICIGLSNVQ